jgi:1,4-dihydroxy-2-naphthoyl-CoA hydrolase
MCRRVDPFDALLGIELSPEAARAEVRVRDELRQRGGSVHGGVHASVADSLACASTAAALEPDVKLTSAIATQVSLLRPITQGTIHAAAVAKHRGRTTWVWEVEITDNTGALCALVRVTVGVRDR